MEQYKHSKALALLSGMALIGACMGQVDELPSETDGVETAGVVEAALIGCPVGSSATPQARTVSSLALEIVNAYNNTYGWTLAGASISSQFYRPAANGGIELVPTNGFPLNQNDAKAALAFAQTDPSVAKYLLDGLNRCRAQTNGERIMLVEALDQAAKMYMGGSSGSLTGLCPSGVGYDKTNPATHYCFAMSWSDQPWCGQRAVTVRRRYKNWSPHTPRVNGDPQLSTVKAVENRGITEANYGWNLNNLNGNRSAYKGSSNLPCTPFEGPAGQNPYFIMAYDGTPRTFSDATLYSAEDCRYKECIREIDVDPVAYMESGDSYNAQGLVGSQANPFALVDTSLYATPSHSSQWATRIVNGVAERGQFSVPYTLFGKTKYKYVKR